MTRLDTDLLLDSHLWYGKLQGSLEESKSRHLNLKIRKIQKLFNMLYEFNCRSLPFGLEAAAGQAAMVAVVGLVAEVLRNCPLVAAVALERHNCLLVA